MPNQWYEIFADGVKIGITVASNATMALQSARLTTTRHTYSKMDTTCDYESLVVSKANAVLLAIGAPLDAMTLVRPVFTVNNSPLPRVMGYGWHRPCSRVGHPNATHGSSAAFTQLPSSHQITARHTERQQQEPASGADFTSEPGGFFNF